MLRARRLSQGRPSLLNEQQLADLAVSAVAAT
jgi:hypothetical protein